MAVVDDPKAIVEAVAIAVPDFPELSFRVNPLAAGAFVALGDAIAMSEAIPTEPRRLRASSMASPARVIVSTLTINVSSARPTMMPNDKRLIKTPDVVAASRGFACLSF